MSSDPIRGKYTIIALWFYVGWVIVFILEGLLAQTLSTRDLTSSLDRQIPLVPLFVWFYVLCYVFPFILIPMTTNWHRFNIAFLSIALCTLIGFIGHIGLPIAFPKPQPGGNSLSEQLVRYIHSHDFLPGAQNFPSLHVAITWTVFFACLRQGRPKLLEGILLIATLLIIASTVLIKQHLFIDLIGGTAVGFLIWWVTSRTYERLIGDSDQPLNALRFSARKMVPALTACVVVLLIVIGAQLI
ncbi:MAG TPA: phosphatase PAP2 family protein [Bacteroidota bacterium]|nr:phosphatase PAP2 family protein [Bacteroidota bacterium]